MIDKNNTLYLLYYLATENSSNDFIDIKKEVTSIEGIPIGKLFFWIKGAWEENNNQLHQNLLDLYFDIMGVLPIQKNNQEVIGPFGSIEELRRFSYLLCQKLNLEKVLLMSVDELNNALKFGTSKENVLEILHKSVEKLENLDKAKNPSILDKLINRK